MHVASPVVSLTCIVSFYGNLKLRIIGITLSIVMRFYLGVTDNSWYNYLSKIFPEDINFWQPGGNSTFKILHQGEPFLFKLKRPFNAIGGIGFFSSHTSLPINIAWDVFGNRNGC